MINLILDCIGICFIVWGALTFIASLVRVAVTRSKVNFIPNIFMVMTGIILIRVQI
jgi:hypothetical protein